MRYGGITRILRIALGLAMLVLAACTTTLSPMQRQELETKVYHGDYDGTFMASRDALVNYGFAIEESDFNGGILVFRQDRLTHNPRTALGLSILAPVGDFYMGRYAWGILDLLLWPLSILWAAPSNYMIAKRLYHEIGATVAIQKLTPDRTRVRLSLSGVSWAADTYPANVRPLQEEIERQLFLRYGESLPMP